MHLAHAPTARTVSGVEHGTVGQTVRAGAELEGVSEAAQHRAEFDEQAFGARGQGIEPTARELVAIV